MVGRAPVANSFWNQVSQNGSDKEIGRLKYWHKLPQSDSPIWCPLQNEVCYTKWFRPWKNEILPPHTKKLGEDQKQMFKKNTKLPNGVHLHMAKQTKSSTNLPSFLPIAAASPESLGPPRTVMLPWWNQKQSERMQSSPAFWEPDRSFFGFKS